MMKPFLLLLFVFTGFGSNAQSELIESLKIDFQRSKSHIISYIDAMPDEHFEYRPTPETRSFAEQMLHVAQGTARLVSNATGIDNPFKENIEKKEDYKTKTEVIRLADESFDFAISSIDNLSAKNYFEIVEKGPFKVTRIGWIMKAYEHMIHHKGQSVVYLRLKGVVPPQYELF